LRYYIINDLKGQENQEKPEVRMVTVWAKIKTWDLLITKQG
jgi:hypothetical protein